MNVEDVREYCLSRKGANESFPFDETTLVFKVMGKMFAFMNLERRRDDSLVVTLKCDPEKAIELRERYDSVIPGYYSNKIHWNSVLFERGIPDQELKYWIDHSIEEVIKKLPKKAQLAYAEMEDSDE